MILKSAFIVFDNWLNKSMLNLC